jgi:hypothetical protein
MLKVTPYRCHPEKRAVGERGVGKQARKYILLLYVSFGGDTFLRFRGNSFFEKFRRNSFFSQKEGEVFKKGAEAPLLRKKGAPAIFLRGLMIRYPDTP